MIETVQNDVGIIGDIENRKAKNGSEMSIAESFNVHFVQILSMCFSIYCFAVDVCLYVYFYARNNLIPCQSLFIADLARHLKINVQVVHFILLLKDLTAIVSSKTREMLKNPRSLSLKRKITVSWHVRYRIYYT